MGSSSSWFVDYVESDDYIWAPQIMDDPTPPSGILGFDVSGKEDARSEISCTRKRFTELCSILDPGRPPKADKVAILSDATRLLNQLRLEAQKLKESNESLQNANKTLKAEKLELKDEKVRLKAEKERIEQMLKGMRIAPPLIPHPAAAAAAFHAAAAFAACNKAVSYPNYPPMGMWQWISPTSLDTSQDHELRPPVA